MITKQDRLNLAHALVFQAVTDLHDILQPEKTHDELISVLIDLVHMGHRMEITCVNTAHHDDSGLSPAPHLGTHSAGWAIDLWPLNSLKHEDYMDASTHNFRAFLQDIAKCKYYYQTGLIGDGADSAKNFIAAGPKAFQDDGGAHVHIGVHPIN